jgi:hypothetical protein
MPPTGGEGRITVTQVLSMEDIEARRTSERRASRVVFGVEALYGLSTQSVELPLGPGESIESGQVCLTLDAEAAAGQNVGVIDFDQLTLRVRYGVQAVFPGLHHLVMSRRHDLSLLRPVRVTATDDCSVMPDLGGWQAFGCLDFLPGSLWSGAKGG